MGVLGIKAAVGASAALSIGFLVWSNGRLRNETAAVRADMALREEANQSNIETIDRLILSNNNCVMMSAVDKLAGEQTVVALNTELEALRAKSPKIVREKIYAEPSCRALGETDIAAACPALAVALRERAAALSQD